MEPQQAGQCQRAVEIIDDLLPLDLKRVLLPLIEDLAAAVRFERLRLLYPPDLYGSAG